MTEAIQAPDAVARLDEAAADALAGRICAAASMTAQSECRLLELIGEFDAGDAVRWWDGAKSLAHWLSWACSMSPGTARERVRVARALRRMPTTQDAFAQGRLSYSKVREVTRVVDTVDETELCELALRATAAQLAKTVSGYRTASGSRIQQQHRRGLTWTERENGLVDLRVRLPKEEAAVLLAAIKAAQDQFGSPPPSPSTPSPDAPMPDMGPDTNGQGAVADSPENLSGSSGSAGGSSVQGDRVDRTTPPYTSADALLDVARVFLDTAPEDRSGEDRSLVVVHVNLDELSDPGQPSDVPAGTSRPNAAGNATDGAANTLPPTDSPAADAPSESPEDVPAGTSHPTVEPTCHIQGVGGIERETARRLACDNDLLGAIVDAYGDVLALGRTHRLVTKALRRALMIRDHGICQFTGCHQSHHLKAHHRIHWADGGPTDLDNLILLCQFHHTAVHEGRMTIRRDAAREWEFLMPDGKPHRDWYSAEGLTNFLARHAELTAENDHERRRRAMVIDNVDSFHHPLAQRIQPGWRGERFDRHEAVQALFRMPIRETDGKAA